MRIAVIGSGISGLGAAYRLARAHEVEVFEREPRAGGHTHTIVHDDLALDTGFLVHNVRNYPLLLRLFEELGVRTQASEMSFSVSCGSCGLECSGRRPFAQARNAASPGFLALLWEIGRWLRTARRSLEQADCESWSLARYLDEHGYSGRFRGHFLVPLTSALWSTAPVAVKRRAVPRRPVAVHRDAAVGEAAEQVVEATAVDPVGVDLDLRERPGPVRDVQLPGALLGQPGREAEVRERRLPALQRPVRAVRGLAAGDEPRELWPVVRAARAPEATPVELAVLAPAAGVVLLELDLAEVRAREARVDRTPDEDAAQAAGRAVGDHRLALAVHGQADGGRVAVDQLRSRGNAR